MGEIVPLLRTRYGLFWRYKVRLFLIIGEPAEVESIAPGLTEQCWLEGDSIVLIHGGNALAEPDAELLASLRKLRRRRPLDGIVWPLTTEQSQQSAQMDKAWRGLTESGKRLGFQAPFICGRSAMMAVTRPNAPSRLWAACWRKIARQNTWPPCWRHKHRD
jgi:type VI secretion system protein ImpL